MRWLGLGLLIIIFLVGGYFANRVLKKAQDKAHGRYSNDDDSPFGDQWSKHQDDNN